MIKKMITKFKNLFSAKEDKESDENETQDKILVTKNKKAIMKSASQSEYIPKNKGDALKFQDEVNTELWLSGLGG